jgi:hypothetical protein
MNLQENINRIKTLMLESKEERIKNTIAQHGLYYTIKLMGGYENLLNHIDHEEISDYDKIVFIKKVVNELSESYGGGGLSTYETDMAPVIYGRDEYESKEIEYFGKERVTIDVYGGHNYDSHMGEVSIDYENLPTDVLDNVFIWMIDALEQHYK